MSCNPVLNTIFSKWRREGNMEGNKEKERGREWGREWERGRVVCLVVTYT